MKKILAKEILFLISAMALITISMFSISWHKKRTNRFISEIEYSHGNKIKSQKWFYEAYDFGPNTSYDRIWKRLNEQAERDSLIYYYNNDWEEDTKKVLLEKNLINASDLQNFTLNNSFKNQDKYYRLKRVSRNYNNYQIWTIATVLVLLFVLRYLVYLVKWSINQLKHNN